MEQMRPLEARRIERGMCQRRLSYRKAIVERQGDVLNFLSGKSRIGRAADGRIIVTKEPRAFKVRLLGDGLVEVCTGIKWSNAGRKVLGGIPAKAITTDIFHALRMAAHIRESEAAEIEAREGTLREIEGVNSSLAVGRGAPSNDLISSSINALRAEILGMLNAKDAQKLSCLPQNDPFIGNLSEEMFRYESKLKIDAGIQLAKAEETLQKALWESNPSARSRLAYNACAQLQAFLNRFGKWRDEEAERIREFNLYREYCLRAERDLRLEELLEKWARDLRGQNPWARMNLWKKDLANAEKVENCALGLGRGCWKERLEALGKELKSKGYDAKFGKYSIVGKLREAYSILLKAEAREGAWEDGKREAREILEHAARILKSDKPAYVLAQLTEGGPEEYLLGDGKKSVYSYISTGVELLERRVPEAAARCFESALGKMQELNGEL